MKKSTKVSENTKKNETPSMIETKTEDGENLTEEAKVLYAQRDFLANVAKPSFTRAADGRRRYDQEWLARNLFWRGFQFSRYLPQSQTVVLSSRQQAKVPINYMASMMRAIRNQATSFRPKWEVLPAHPSKTESKTQARYSQRVLDYYFDILRLKTKIKETLTQGLLYSVGGPWEIFYDPIKKRVGVWLLDPFDFYVDPMAEDFLEAEYVIKAVRRPLAEVKTNPHFNPVARAEITGGENKIAASEYKQFMIQSVRNVTPKASDYSSSLILYQGDFRQREVETGKQYLVRCIWTESNLTPLSYEELDESEFDYEMYRADLNPKEIYGESWAKHVMPINRTLNNLETSTFEYNYRFAKGRIVVDRDSGVRAISNVHGEIISKNRGSEVKSLDLSPLPVSVPNQIQRMWRYMEDISGVHEASLGRVPTGVRTGVGIAELKQSDATSQDDLVDNLEDFLSNVGKKLLKKIAKNYTSYELVRDLGVREGNEKYFAIIGEGFRKTDKNRMKGKENMIKIGPDWLDLVEIGSENHIRVTVGSWLGYTKESLQQKVMSYFQSGLIDQKTALRLLEFGDIDDIVQQTRVEGLLKRPANQNNPQQPDQMALAMTENEMLLEGKPVPPSELDDHLVHISVHQEALGQGFDDMVGEHINKHIILLGQEPPEVPTTDVSQVQPQGPSFPTGQAIPGVSEAPVGPPAGTQLPQQDMETAMLKNQQTAQGAVGGGGGITQGY